MIIFARNNMIDSLIIKFNNYYRMLHSNIFLYFSISKRFNNSKIHLELTKIFWPRFAIFIITRISFFFLRDFFDIILSNFLLLWIVLYIKFVHVSQGSASSADSGRGKMADFLTKSNGGIGVGKMATGNVIYSLINGYMDVNFRFIRLSEA